MNYRIIRFNNFLTYKSGNDLDQCLDGVVGYFFYMFGGTGSFLKTFINKVDNWEYSRIMISH
ncbi:hypothetical protein [Flavobacterium sp. CGRL2]